jgi:hypothetical protein
VAFPESSEKRSPRGLAEYRWQSSTWPINLVYLSTMYYKECANHLQEEILEILKFLWNSDCHEYANDFILLPCDCWVSCR